MITTKSVEFTDKDGSLKFEVSSSGGLVVSCVGGQPWELTDEQAMEVYALLDQAIVADRWIRREQTLESGDECERKRRESPGVWCCDKHMKAYEREIAAAYEHKSKIFAPSDPTLTPWSIKPGPDLREAPVRDEERNATVHVEPGDFGNIVVRGSSWDPPAVPRQVAGDFGGKP